MRGWWLIPLLLACKDKHPITKDTVIVDMAACERAIDKAVTAPLDARPRLVIDGCPVCGDWKPLLEWNVDPATGGPKNDQIEKLMTACHAFCTGDSKMKFMAGVDKVRGQSVNTPWRQLADACKGKVDASPDPRFMSAPYFALDRIAREVAAFEHGRIATKLDAVELPLPPITVSGAGVALPDADGVTPTTGTVQITVVADQLFVGTLPRAKLTAAGVKVDLGTAGYPGDQTTLDRLAGKLRDLGSDKLQSVTILAPQGMLAAKLVDIIGAASAVAPVYLAANATESPTGWQLAGTIPIRLEAGHDIEVTAEMTVQNLARELAARAARKESKVGVTKH